MPVKVFGITCYDIKEAAAKLNYSERHLRLLCASGVLGQKVSERKWLISEPELTLFIRTHRRGAGAGKSRAQKSRSSAVRRRRAVKKGVAPRRRKRSK